MQWRSFGFINTQTYVRNSGEVSSHATHPPPTSVRLKGKPIETNWLLKNTLFFWQFAHHTTDFGCVLKRKRSDTIVFSFWRWETTDFTWLLGKLVVCWLRPAMCAWVVPVTSTSQEMRSLATTFLRNKKPTLSERQFRALFGVPSEMAAAVWDCIKPFALAYTRCGACDLLLCLYFLKTYPTSLDVLAAVANVCADVVLHKVEVVVNLILQFIESVCARLVTRAI